MTYIPARCDTVMIPTGPAGDHMFVITTQACSQGQHLLVNATSIKPNRFVDPTCVLAPGEHPFIIDDSFILYRAAQLQGANRIAKMVDGWVYRTGQPASEALTDRILAGFRVSRFTPCFILKYLSGIGL
jgi:hypothetical protein